MAERAPSPILTLETGIIPVFTGDPTGFSVVPEQPQVDTDQPQVVTSDIPQLQTGGPTVFLITSTTKLVSKTTSTSSKVSLNSTGISIPSKSSTSSTQSSTTSSESSSATAAAVTTPDTDPSLPASTKIALGVTIPIIVLTFLGIGFYFLSKKRRTSRNRTSNNGGVAEFSGMWKFRKSLPPEKDSDPIYEAEAGAKRAELSAKRDTTAELEGTRQVHELDGRR